MPVEQALIEVKDVSFAYGGNTVLEHVSFNVDKGDYVGVVGPNGGGKTTLLKILVGLLPLQSGSVKIGGVPIAEFKNRFEIGYVPQKVAQDAVSFPATVYEVVESGVVAKKSAFGRINESDRQTVEKVLRMARIDDLNDKLIGALSGGQRQRVYVARALAGQPKILALDEPFVGIDINAQAEFYSFLKNLNRTQNLTILLISHDVDVIAQEVKSIICLNRGLLCFGSPQVLHGKDLIETLYGKKITHIHLPT